MSLTTGQNGVASDFINESEKDATAANDNGRVPKLEQVAGTDRKLSGEWHRAPIVRVYTANDTWTKPADHLSHIVVEVMAAGGGSKGVGNPGSGDQAATGGAGAGGYSRKVIPAASLSSSETVTVGAAGTAGASGGVGNGGNGGTSSFGAHLSATGGNGSTGSTGATGGVGSGGDLNITGGSGMSEGTGSTSSGGSEAYPGAGGVGVFGGTGAYGAGGVGAFGDEAAAAGNPGIAGVVIVTEYY